MKKSFVVEVFVDIEIEDSKVEQIVEEYRKYMYNASNASINDVFSQIAYNEVNGGGFCEGVGENGEDFKAEITGIEIDYEVEPYE
jgi:hypothetical protein